jgi:pyruvate carboxylase subunit B
MGRVSKGEAPSATELVEASLRHGQQALLVSRLRERHAVEVARQLDRCGFAALDVFGGATFEAQVRFLGENPFERLRAIRKAAKSTPLMANLAAQSLVGHHHYADDVVDAFIKLTADAGIDIIRISDPLNDARNFERAISAAKHAKKTVEGVIVHSDHSEMEQSVLLAQSLQDLGCDRLCIHDPLGILNMSGSKSLVSAIRAVVELPIGVSVSAQTGQADLACISAIEGGATRIDTALSPLAGGTSFPASEAILAALVGSDAATNLDLGKIAQAAAVLESVLVHYLEIGDPTALRLDTAALLGKVPATAMGPALAELRERDALDRIGDVEKEISKVRKELGMPPLVTPLTEIIATQAVYNVTEGGRYLAISQEVKDYCLGLYGTPPGPIDKKVQSSVNGRESPITCRPADLIDPALPNATKECKRDGIEPTSENVVGVALFGQEWIDLARGVSQVELLGDEKPEATADVVMAAPVSVEVEPQSVAAGATPAHESRDLTVEVDGQSYAVRVTGAPGSFSGSNGASAVAVPAPPAAGAGAVLAPMQGLILKVVVKVGDQVSIGDVVAVLEAMKMQNDVTATKAGTVTAIHVNEGSVVSANDPVVSVS